jgi:DNA-binding transcriptional MerR regulator
MEPRDLKMAIMQLKTKNGHIIRDYYIDLEELLKLYVEYTLYFNHRETQRKITDLEQMMSDMRLSNQRQEQIMLQQAQYMRSLGISLEEVKDQNEELLDKTQGLEDQNHDLKKEVKKVQRKLGIAVEDRAPLPVDEDKQERFVLIKRNDDHHFEYYTIRAQHGYTERKLKAQRILFPELEILLDFKANPNSKTLYNRIKDTLKAKNVQFCNNDIDLGESEVTEDELVEEMKVINDQKYNV